MRIALVREGFGLEASESGAPASEQVVDERVRAAAKQLEKLGAAVDEISLPWHRDGVHVYTGIMMEGATDFMIRGNGIGTNWQGFYNTNLGEAIAKGMAAKPNDVPYQVLSVLLTGEYAKRNYYGRYYAKAQNIRRTLVAAYDEALKTFDILAMPTTPIRSTKQVGRDAGIAESISSGFSMLRNTCVADVTGHPSISVPCGLSDGLPIGLMLTGRKLQDNVLIAASQAFESLGDWKAM